VEFRVLGPLDVVLDGQRVPIVAAKQRALLATLLLRANQPTSVSVIAERLWRTDPPSHPRRAVHTHVTRLRDALGPHRELIRTQPDGYLIELRPDQLDLTVFGELLDRAMACDDVEESVGLLDRAGELWRGTPLSNVESDVLHANDVSPLIERWLLARERRMDAGLRLGQQHDLVPELVELTTAYPWHERFWVQLMLALDRCGRTGDALMAYEAARGRLVHEFGIDPGEALRATHAAIRSGGRAGTERPPGWPRQLPPDVRGFTGRATELALLDAYLSKGPAACVITGTAGVGKTALAVHWAHRVAPQFPDGQLYLNLRGYDPGRPMTSDHALELLLRAVGVSGSEIPPGEDARGALLRSRLADRQVLMVLDNASSPDQIRPLLPGTPSCRILVTSRDDLAGLVARDGAARINVGRLGHDDATGVLRHLLPPSDHDVAALEQLVRLCDRLPLALRIAADRVASRVEASVSEAVADLSAQPRLDALATEGDAHSAVDVVLSWSYRSVSRPAARMFRLLGLVPGSSWDARAAAALAGCSLVEARRQLDALAAGHLVEVRADGRYVMHDLLRAYALDRAQASETRTRRRAATGRLLDYYVQASALAMDTAFAFERHRRPEVPPAMSVPPPCDPKSALAWLDAQRPALIAAIVHAAEDGWPEHTVTLAATLHRYLFVGAHHTDLLTVHGHALRCARTEAERGIALHNLGRAHLRLGRFDEAIDETGQALTVAEHTGDLNAEADALQSIGMIHMERGQWDEAATYVEHALALARATGDRSLEARALGSLGQVSQYQGHYLRSLDHVREALALFREIGDRATEADALIGTGALYGRLGDDAAAFDHLEQALAVARGIGDRHREASALEHLGDANRRQRRYPLAGDLYRQALALFREIGDIAREASCLIGLGSLAARDGCPAQALAQHELALAKARQIGHRRGEVRARNALGESLLAAGRPIEASASYELALVLADKLGDRYEQARALAGIGAVRHDLGDGAGAQDSWMRAERGFASLGVRVADGLRTELARSS
jgi:DNA-binding SARP family transcriptional activator/tetratricopeptide (TPR) repeat protein